MKIKAGIDITKNCLDFYDNIHIREYDIPHDEWRRCLPLENEQSSFEAKVDTSQLYHELIVYDILGTCKRRIGSVSDGGYVVAEQGLD